MCRYPDVQLSLGCSALLTAATESAAASVIAAVAAAVTAVASVIAAVTAATVDCFVPHIPLSSRERDGQA